MGQVEVLVEIAKFKLVDPSWCGFEEPWRNFCRFANAKLNSFGSTIFNSHDLTILMLCKKLRRRIRAPHIFTDRQLSKNMVSPPRRGHISVIF